MKTKPIRIRVGDYIALPDQTVKPVQRIVALHPYHIDDSRDIELESCSLDDLDDRYTYRFGFEPDAEWADTMSCGGKKPRPTMKWFSVHDIEPSL